MNDFEKFFARVCPVCGIPYPDHDLPETDGLYRCKGCGNFIYTADQHPVRKRPSLDSYLATYARNDRRFGLRV